MAVIHSEGWVVANKIAEWCNVSVRFFAESHSLLQIRLIEFAMPHTVPYVAIAFQKNSTFYPEFERVWRALTETY